MTNKTPHCLTAVRVWRPFFFYSYRQEIISSRNLVDLSSRKFFMYFYLLFCKKLLYIIIGIVSNFIEILPCQWFDLQISSVLSTVWWYSVRFFGDINFVLTRKINFVLLAVALLSIFFVPYEIIFIFQISQGNFFLKFFEECINIFCWQTYMFRQSCQLLLGVTTFKCSWKFSLCDSLRYLLTTLGTPWPGCRVIYSGPASGPLFLSPCFQIYKRHDAYSRSVICV